MATAAPASPVLPEHNSARLAERRFSHVAIGSLLAALMTLTFVIALLTGVSSDHFMPVLASYAMLGLWAGLIVSAGAHVIAVFRPGKWRPDIRLGWLLTAMLLSGITLPLFELFKQIILPQRGYPFDPFLAAADRLLFFGHDGWQVTHALFGNLAATTLFDAAYAIWLPLMFIFPPVMVVAISDVGLRMRLLSCWLASWVLIAGIGAWIFGSAGPCYYNDLVGPNSGFKQMQQALMSISAQGGGRGIAALDFQAMLLRDVKAGSLVSAGGISAMPSMHVAMATLFAIAGYCYSKRAGRSFAAYAVLIWVGSVHLGWHYAVDGIVGAAMMVGLWMLISRIDTKINQK